MIRKVATSTVVANIRGFATLHHNQLLAAAGQPISVITSRLMILHERLYVQRSPNWERARFFLLLVPGTNDTGGEGSLPN